MQSKRNMATKYTTVDKHLTQLQKKMDEYRGKKVALDRESMLGPAAGLGKYIQHPQVNQGSFNDSQAQRRPEDFAIEDEIVERSKEESSKEDKLFQSLDAIHPTTPDGRSSRKVLGQSDSMDVSQMQSKERVVKKLKRQNRVLKEEVVKYQEIAKEYQSKVEEMRASDRSLKQLLVKEMKSKSIAPKKLKRISEDTDGELSMS